MTREAASQIEDAAARWVARMDSGGWNALAEAELADWLAGDPRRDGALLQAQAAMAMLDPVETGAEQGAHERPRRVRITRRWMLAGGSTAIAASLVGGIFLSLRDRIYETDVGEIRRVPLADGSTAAINTASKVAIDLRDHVRVVRVERGEAWFQVAKDANRPFVVESGRVRVRAVGTAFSVRRRDDGIDVLVTEGVVEAWADGAEGQTVRIAAGGRAFVGDNAAVERAPAQASGVDRALAWRSGNIDLVGQPLSQAVAEFNRYNRRQLIIADPALMNERFDGVFRTNDPVGFAAMLQTSLEVPVDMSDPERITIGRSHK